MIIQKSDAEEVHPMEVVPPAAVAMPNVPHCSLPLLVGVKEEVCGVLTRSVPWHAACTLMSLAPLAAIETFEVAPVPLLLARLVSAVVWLTPVTESVLLPNKALVDEIHLPATRGAAKVITILFAPEVGCDPAGQV